MTQMPVYKLMRVLRIERATTSVSNTTKMNVECLTDEVFFFMNKNDHEKMNDKLLRAVESQIALKKNPFTFIAKTRDGLCLAFFSHGKTHFF